LRPQTVDHVKSIVGEHKMVKPDKETRRLILKDAVRAAAWEQIPSGIGGVAVAAILHSQIMARTSDQLSQVERIVLLAIVVSAAFLAAIFKKKALTSYGFAEMTFGIAVAWRIIWSQLSPDRLTNGLALIAATFLVSRGVQNFYDGIIKEREDAKKFVEQLVSADSSR
jgi:hypothetical protein